MSRGWCSSGGAACESEDRRFPPDGEPGFVTMERGSSSIGIGAGGDSGDDACSLWVYVDDVDETLAVLGVSGAPVAAEPEDDLVLPPQLLDQILDLDRSSVR